MIALPDWVGPNVAAMAACDPAVAEAVAFCDTFAPAEGVEYGWAIARAKEQYASAESTYKYLDEKCNWILVYLGGGSGAISAAWAAGVASDKISPWAALAVLPALAVAVRVLVQISFAKVPQDSVYPPSAKDAVRRAEFYAEEPSKAEASSLGSWHLASVIMQRVAAQKADVASDATWNFAWAVVLLALSVVFAAALKLAETAASPAP